MAFAELTFFAVEVNIIIHSKPYLNKLFAVVRNNKHKTV
jgi:hypothetical protein